LPGEKGRSFIFAHSSGNPIEQTNYNTVFLRLNEVKIGDEIEIKRAGKVYKYNVTQSKVVWPSEIEYLERNDTPGIIIQTCWPIGTSLKRLLVFASPSS
jgi:sortase A